MSSNELLDLPFFKEKGFVKKKCKSCGKVFWTLNPDQEYCGDQPCVSYEFIENPCGKRFGSISEAREAFIGFFEKHGHTRVNRYPVVARWRDDVYLVGASIYDFQPWVTEGLVDPPANPLVISQPSIRLTDVDNVGKTGRHLTGFEMMAHHAFNVRGASVYWADETVRYAFEVLTEAFGIPAEEITFKFDWWSGGGNAGEDYEVLVRGLEVATLVFMHYKVVDGKPIPMENRIVDTGYGLERLYWLTTGTYTVYDAVFGEVVEWIRRQVGVPSPPSSIRRALAVKSGQLDYKEPAKAVAVKREIASQLGLTVDELEEMLAPHEAIYTVADHTRSLVWMLGDGIVPSNTGAGYLARLLLRRAFRHLTRLGVSLSLVDVVNRQIDVWMRDFPEYAEVRDEILDMVEWEEKRYADTIKRGCRVVSRLVARLKKQGLSEVPLSELITLYESHGLTPEIVAEEAAKSGISVKVPPDFYSMLAAKHEESTKPRAPDEVAARFADAVSKLPPTKLIYYEDPGCLEFTAKVVSVLEGGYVVLDRTAVYPEGGGQPADTAIIETSDGRRCRVKWAYRVGRVVLHLCEPCAVRPGDSVFVRVDGERRRALMRGHTATHIVLGAARRVLGRHVWQAGAQKGVDQNRLDITHHKRVSREELEEIEMLANRVVTENRRVITRMMPRNEAEKRYGFVLYQGGVVPEPVLRVVEIEGWDVEACGGLHCSRTGEVGFIKIVKAERIQDGVTRLVFKVGEAAVRYVQERERCLLSVAEALDASDKDLEAKAKSMKESIEKLSREVQRLKQEIAEMRAREAVSKAEVIGELRLVVIKAEDVGMARELALAAARVCPGVVAVALASRNGQSFYVVKVGDGALKRGIDARRIADAFSRELGGKGGGVRDLAQGVVPLPLEKACGEVARVAGSALKLAS